MPGVVALVLVGLALVGVSGLVSRLAASANHHAPDSFASALDAADLEASRLNSSAPRQASGQGVQPASARANDAGTAAVGAPGSSPCPAITFTQLGGQSSVGVPSGEGVNSPVDTRPADRSSGALDIVEYTLTSDAKSDGIASIRLGADPTADATITTAQYAVWFTTSDYKGWYKVAAKYLATGGAADAQATTAEWQPSVVKDNSDKANTTSAHYDPSTFTVTITFSYAIFNGSGMAQPPPFVSAATKILTTRASSDGGVGYADLGTGGTRGVNPDGSSIADQAPESGKGAGGTPFCPTGVSPPSAADNAPPTAPPASPAAARPAVVPETPAAALSHERPIAAAAIASSGPERPPAATPSPAPATPSPAAPTATVRYTTASSHDPTVWHGPAMVVFGLMSLFGCALAASMLRT